MWCANYKKKFLDAAKEGNLNKIKELTSKKGLFGTELISLNNHDEIKDECFCGHTALIWASSCGHLHIVRFLLMQENSVNADGKNNDGNTALHYASGNGHLHVMQYLIDNGANVNQQDHDGSTPLHYAIFRSRLLIAVKILLQRGANPNIPNNQNKTALYWAKQLKLHDIANEILLHIHDGQDETNC